MKNKTASRNLLVTGGAGFLSINLIRPLVKHGYRVTSLDIAPFSLLRVLDIRRWLKKDEIIALFRDTRTKDEVFSLFNFYNVADRWEKIKWVECDILDIERFYELTIGVDQIFHCAALVSFDPSHAEKLQSWSPSVAIINGSSPQLEYSCHN